LKAAAFVLSALAGIALILVLKAVQLDIFSPNSTVVFYVGNARDISEGKTVNFRGFKIGKVDKIILNDDARVRVELSIKTRYMKWIKRDSVARMQKDGFIGDSIIDIKHGSPESKPLGNNGRIEFKRERSLTEMVEELKNEITPVIKEAGVTMKYVNDPDGDIRLTLENVRKISSRLNAAGGRLDTLISSADIAVANLNLTITGTNETVVLINDSLKKINAGLPDNLAAINDILAATGKNLENIDAATRDIRKITGKTAAELPEIMDATREAVENARDIAESVKKIWPIRTNIPAPAEKALKPGAYER
jgi:phospholipid/cholesterol/gamma-HCH transport system substrate-binding protein